MLQKVYLAPSTVAEVYLELAPKNQWRCRILGKDRSFSEAWWLNDDCIL
jgi:hypothetical protein